MAQETGPASPQPARPKPADDASSSSAAEGLVAVARPATPDVQPDPAPVTPAVLQADLQPTTASRSVVPAAIPESAPKAATDAVSTAIPAASLNAPLDATRARGAAAAQVPDAEGVAAPGSAAPVPGAAGPTPATLPAAPAWAALVPQVAQVAAATVEAADPVMPAGATAGTAATPQARNAVPPVPDAGTQPTQPNPQAAGPAVAAPPLPDAATQAAGGLSALLATMQPGAARPTGVASPRAPGGPGAGAIAPPGRGADATADAAANGPAIPGAAPAAPDLPATLGAAIAPDAALAEAAAVPGTAWTGGASGRAATGARRGDGDDASPGTATSGQAPALPPNAVPLPTPAGASVAASDTPAPVHAAAPAGRAPPPSVTDQVLPTVVAMAQGRSAGQHVSIVIRPDELGQVSITVGRAADGTTTVQVGAEHLATLDLLRKDQANLAHALDQAGIGQGSHRLSFSWDGGSSGGQGWNGQAWSNPDGNGGGGRLPGPSRAYDEPTSPTQAATARRGVDLTA